jgi:hypothetical protein
MGVCHYKKSASRTRKDARPVRQSGRFDEQKNKNFTNTPFSASKRQRKYNIIGGVEMDKVRVFTRVFVARPSFFKMLSELRKQPKASIDAGSLGVVQLVTAKESTWDAYMNAFKFILRNAWVRICLTDNTASDNVSVEFSSLALATVGLKKLWQSFVTWIEKVLGKIEETKVSRLDLKTDVAGLTVRKTLLRSFISRAKLNADFLPEVRENYRGQSINGFTVGKRGKAGIYFRLYDKRREIVDEHDDWWYKVWKKKSGIDYEHEQANEPIARVEFELSRRILRQFRIETVSDLLAGKTVNAAWKYLTTTWIRFVNRTDKNISRCPLLNVWKIIQDATLQEGDVPMGSASPPAPEHNAGNERTLIYAKQCLTKYLVAAFQKPKADVQALVEKSVRSLMRRTKQLSL